MNQPEIIPPKDIKQVPDHTLHVFAELFFEMICEMIAKEKAGK